MIKNRYRWAAGTVAAALLAAVLPPPAARAQSRDVQPERRLLGVSLGRPFLEVIRRFGQPSEIQTVALATTTEQLPALGGGAGGEMGAPGMPGMGAMGGSPFGGGGMGMTPGGMTSPFGMGSSYPGGMGAPGGIPTLPPAGGSGFGGPGMGGPGMGGSGYPGGGGEFGGGAMGAGGQALPEYSNAILWIYKRGKDKTTRIEFLINEDGRIAQISVAAPANQAASMAKLLPGSMTQRKITLGSNLTRVMDAYGYPERHRLLPGLRFYEVYYSKNYHAAFTFDTQKNMTCVRITIALAD